MYLPPGSWPRPSRPSCIKPCRISLSIWNSNNDMTSWVNVYPALWLKPAIRRIRSDVCMPRNCFSSISERFSLSRISKINVWRIGDTARFQILFIIILLNWFSKIKRIDLIVRKLCAHLIVYLMRNEGKYSSRFWDKKYDSNNSLKYSGTLY